MAQKLSTISSITANDRQYKVFSLNPLAKQYDLKKLPYSLKILLENLLRHQDSGYVSDADIKALCEWDPQAEPATEIAFTPARVILQDFTGVPAVVDLAAMRDAMSSLGGNPELINPLAPVELVIDHSVQVDEFGKADSLEHNNIIEFKRNRERYQFLRWGQTAFENFKVVPPNTGIVHQVNLEYLGRVVFGEKKDGEWYAWPDTLVGTDSHTTMINGLGVLGWGVGGIEAEAAMLGQPVTMLIPQVVGFKLTGKLPDGTTATDLVLTVTEMLRKHGVVGKFVEFYGDGLSNLPLADRATLGNMSPEYGATCAIFPVDAETLRYLRASGRSEEQINLVEAYMRHQGMFREDGDSEAQYSASLTLDMGEVLPSIAGPKRPQDRILLDQARAAWHRDSSKIIENRVPSKTSEARFEGEGGNTAVGACSNSGCARVEYADKQFDLKDGAIVVAAITSCTNTSNPAVMIGAGLLARNAAARGLSVKPWVKTSLAPGSKVVTDYLKQAELLDDLEALGFYVVGYGCTTCIGNSGPLPESIAAAIREHDLVACSVLSGNRNFEGRIHSDVKMNYLASPPLVVAYALAGTMDIDLANDALGEDQDGKPVYLQDIWPDAHEIQDFIVSSINADMYTSSYDSVFKGDEHWNALQIPEGKKFDWQDNSTYIQNPPYFEGMTLETPAITDIQNARCLVKLGDSITTDHISPAGAIAPKSPAGQYLQGKGVKPEHFNSYGSRRGNHEVMMRGTFANVRLRNELAPGKEGSWTTLLPDGEEMSIFEASRHYIADNIPLVVIGGAEYGTGSSRDWAAKGTALLGVKAVIAKSFERIHRSNLIGMGVLPLTFKDGDSAESLGLTGKEQYSINGLDDGKSKTVTVTATADEGKETTFACLVRLDTPQEVEYYRHGGILHYVLRQLASNPPGERQQVA
ncbi:MAG: aconitate hydratase AcnA [Gammaproteobacteria bacterium]|jgi:aconitate hydratase|nr:aconitate hydratase AcnA [Gammaproteobacteria bacterium]